MNQMHFKRLLPLLLILLPYCHLARCPDSTIIDWNGKNMIINEQLFFVTYPAQKPQGFLPPSLQPESCSQLPLGYLNAKPITTFYIRNHTDDPRIFLSINLRHMRGIFLTRYPNGNARTGPVRYYGDNRETNTTRANFLLNVPPGTMAKFLVQIQAENELVDGTFTLFDTASFIEHIEDESMRYGAVYGIIFLFFLLNLIFSAILRDNVFLVFSFYVLTQLIVIFHLDGVLLKYVQDTYWTEQIFFTAGHFWIIWITVYTYLLFKHNKQNVLVRRIVKGIIIYALLLTALQFVFRESMLEFFRSLEIFNPLITFLFLTIILVQNRKRAPAMFWLYLCGFGCVAVGLMMILLRVVGIVEANPYDVGPIFWLKMGIIGEFLLLSAAAAIRFHRSIKRLHEKQNAELRLQLQKQELEENKWKLLEKQWRLERRKWDLEQQVHRAQMKSHALSNAMTMISSLVSARENEKAEDALKILGRMHKHMLTVSTQAFISLHSELEMIKQYLELEKIKMGRRFHYQFAVDKNCDTKSIDVPPMLLQPFVENAIVHGLRPKTGMAILQVSIEIVDENTIRCTISDDGVGRHHAPKTRFGKPVAHEVHSLEITQQRIDQLNHDVEGAYSFRFVDHVDENETPCGTSVIVMIPLS